LIDPLKNNPNYVAGIPYEELKDWDVEEIERLIEISDGIKLGYSDIKDSLKNHVMINFVKFLNNNLGTAFIYNPEREPAYIDGHKILNDREYEKHRKKVNRNYNDLNRRLMVEEFIGNIESKIKSYFKK